MSLDDSEPQEWSEHIQVITRIRPINRREVESEKDMYVNVPLYCFYSLNRSN